MRHWLQLLIIAIALLWWQDADAAPLFEEDSVIDVELIGPLYSMTESADKRMEVPFVLRSNGVEYEVMVRPRGKSRLRVCEFPPLRLRFTAEDPGQGVFAGQDKLKLVTHCRNNEKGDQNAIEEYAAYRLFSLLSDKSLRARPMRITYSDTEGKLSGKARQRYAFAIEPLQQLAQRSGGEPFEARGLPVSRLNLEQASLVYVFQYMIGNTDWSFVLAEDDDTCCHNGDLLEIDQSIYFVPYDFDLAGIVNANYAKPDPSLRLKNVRQRRYRGYCTDQDSVRAALQYVKSKQSEIIQTVNAIPGLSGDDRSTMSEYLEQFFEKAENEDKLLRRFEKRCVG